MTSSPGPRRGFSVSWCPMGPELHWPRRRRMFNGGVDLDQGEAAALSGLADEQLISRIAAGETAALREIYERYKRVVYGFAMRSLGDRESAEEVALDVFTQVWRNASRYSGSRAKVSTWILSICRHRSIDAFRRSSARAHHRSLGWDDLPPEAFPVDEETPDGTFARNEARRRVRQAVRGLPKEQAQALSLAFFKGLTHQEIAASLGQPLGTVKTRIRLALAKLARVLHDE
jgi:RNA polymerase sigma-70 factor (ECF subfamily)